MIYVGVKNFDMYSCSLFDFDYNVMIDLKSKNNYVHMPIVLEFLHRNMLIVLMLWDILIKRFFLNLVCIVRVFMREKWNALLFELLLNDLFLTPNNHTIIELLNIPFEIIPFFVVCTYQITLWWKKYLFLWYIKYFIYCRYNDWYYDLLLSRFQTILNKILF